MRDRRTFRITISQTFLSAFLPAVCLFFCFNPSCCFFDFTQSVLSYFPQGTPRHLYHPVRDPSHLPGRISQFKDPFIRYIPAAVLKESCPYHFLLFRRQHRQGQFYRLDLPLDAFPVCSIRLLLLQVIRISSQNSLYDVPTVLVYSHLSPPNARIPSSVLPASACTSCQHSAYSSHIRGTVSAGTLLWLF